MWVFVSTLLVITAIQLLRRRLGQAVVLSLSIAGLGLVDYVVHEWAIRTLHQDSEALEIYPWLLYAHLAYLVCILCLLVLALLRAGKRAKKSQSSTKIWIASAGSVAAALAVTVWLVPAFDHAFVALRQDGFSHVRTLSPKHYEAIAFNQNIYFDKPNLWGKVSLPVLFGSGAIDGKVTYLGLPADVSIRAFFGDYWRTKTIRTGEVGVFSIKVPSGSIEINRLDFYYWFNKPSDEQERLVVVKGLDLSFSDSFFDSARYAARINSNGSRQINLEIVDFIDLEWPLHGAMEQNGDKDTLIAWQPVIGAAYYEITVSKYDSSNHRARDHYQLTVRSPKILLSDFPLAESAEKAEFYVMIRAFSEEKAFLSTSRSGFGNTSFWIPGFTIRPNLER